MSGATDDDGTFGGDEWGAVGDDDDDDEEEAALFEGCARARGGGRARCLMCQHVLRGHSICLTFLRVLW